MASTYTTRLRLEKQANGENDTTWGDKLNTVFDLLDEARGGFLAKSVAGGSDVTLTANNASADESRQAIIELTGVITADINVIVPTAENWWIFKNSTTGSFAVTIKTSAGTGETLTQGKEAIFYCDGTNVAKILDGPTLEGLGTIATQSAASVAITGGSITGITDLAVADGGTGASDASTARSNLGLGTVATESTVPVSKGGTGATSLTANNVILGNGTSAVQLVAPGDSGNVLTSNGTTWASSAPASAGYITGEIRMWPTSSAPSGFLVADGSAISRTTYATLYSLIGTTFGSGDGSTTFNLPNFQNKFPLGVGTNAVGATGGAFTKTIATTNLPSHTHSVSASGTTSSDGAHVHDIYSGDGSNGANSAFYDDGSLQNGWDTSPTTRSGAVVSNGSHTHTVTVSGTSGSTGSGTALDVTNPFLAIYFIIKT